MTTAFPTDAEYRKVFALSRLGLTKTRRWMMTLHLRAPNHEMTATEMAKAFSYDSYAAINAQYGYLASKVARRMKWAMPGTSLLGATRNALREVRRLR